MQGAAVLTSGQLLVGAAGLLHRQLVGYGDRGVELGAESIEPAQECLGQLD